MHHFIMTFKHSGVSLGQSVLGKLSLIDQWLPFLLEHGVELLSFLSCGGVAGGISVLLHPACFPACFLLRVELHIILHMSN